ncbi:hypothetical protein CEXT_342661 [Caerostris extrusa]|uniref:Uncharacterized protein n=1 Tax=Caerostris extrusa TaxID=172846 RepID=A0AAV4TQZ2_CAEEX|nr:hypothetical protein CEXT_342661 [Caerostris extrusa]
MHALLQVNRRRQSGEEGIYPHLIQFCENKLKELDPSNPQTAISKGIGQDSILTKHTKINQELQQALFLQLGGRIIPPTPQNQRKGHFDVEKELEKIDDGDKSKDMEESIKIDESVSVAGLSQAERSEHIANLERIKGNEAFKAQDYEEAAFVLHAQSVCIQNKQNS